MRPGRLLLALCCLCGAGLIVFPALAADGSVTAGGVTFSPATVTVSQNEKVTWTRADGTHNVHFEDGSYTQPPQANPTWSTVERTFATPGTYAYYCQQHGSPSGGMRGTVTVRDPNATPTPDPTSTATATASATPGITPTPSPDPTPVATARPAALTVTPTRTTFCSRRRRGCTRPGVTLQTRAERAIVVTGLLRRRPLSGGRWRAWGRLRWTAPAGTAARTFRRTRARRPIGPGRYRLTVRATGVEHDRLRFRVRG